MKDKKENKALKKVINISVVIIILLAILNTVLALVSYGEVTNKKEPTISFGKSENDVVTVYNELLYNIKVTDDGSVRTVSLKLFFLD